MKKTFKQLLIELNACKPAIEWAANKTIEEVITDCHRGDWLLWLAHNIDLPLNKLTLAKARCAKTVIHLMKDQKSIDAVNIAERFGLDECTLKELNNASDASYAAYASSSYAANAASYASYTAANAASDASYAASYAAYAADARVKNQQKTADICKEILGLLIINKINELLNS